MFRCVRNPNGAEEQLTESEKRVIARRDGFNATGRGYIEEQSTKVGAEFVIIVTSKSYLTLFGVVALYDWSRSGRIPGVYPCLARREVLYVV